MTRGAKCTSAGCDWRKVGRHGPAVFHLPTLARTSEAAEPGQKKDKRTPLSSPIITSISTLTDIPIRRPTPYSIDSVARTPLDRR